MKKEDKHNCPDKQKFDDQKGRCVDDGIKRKIKPNCPEDQKFDVDAGRCIQPNLEIVDGDAYPERRNHSASNLDLIMTFTEIQL